MKLCSDFRTKDREDQSTESDQICGYVCFLTAVSKYPDSTAYYFQEKANPDIMDGADHTQGTTSFFTYSNDCHSQE